MSEQLVHSLAGRYYTDPAVYDLEQAGLFARTWQYAGHISQLKNEGDYFAFELAEKASFVSKGGMVRYGPFTMCVSIARINWSVAKGQPAW